MSTKSDPTGLRAELNPGDDEAELRMLRAAVHGARDAYKNGLAKIGGLRAFYESADTCNDEMEAYIVDLLETHLNLLTTQIKVDEAYQRAYGRGGWYQQLLIALLDEMDKFVLMFGSALWQHREKLNFITGSRYIKNCRMQWPSEYDHLLPWWLDGDGTMQLGRDWVL